MRKNSDCFVTHDNGKTWETFNRKGSRSNVTKRAFVQRDADGKYMLVKKG